MKTFIHLGRNGDIINTLPLLRLAAQRAGAPVGLVVSAEYVGLLDGVSYVEPVPFNGPFTALPQAISYARTLDAAAVNLQVYGHGHQQAHSSSSFILEQWRNAGMEQEWGAPLVFDQRSPLREMALVNTHSDGRPLVLVATEGFSSPFPHRAALLQMLHQHYGERVQVLDLSQVRAHRFYDLLGLFDRAAALVTIDTAHMHLAHGSRVPVVALATDGPTPWHSSPRRAGHIWYGRYSTFLQERAAILGALDKVLAPAQEQGAAPRVALRGDARIIHVYPQFAMDADTQRRCDTARRSWERNRDTAWTDHPVQESELVRDARSVGDHRSLPFVRSLVEAAIAESTSDQDIILLSNSDVCMVGGISARIRSLAGERGAFYTHRWDFDHPVHSVGNYHVATGRWYPGSDLFGFTLAWWKEHGHRYPDMLMGAEFVDAVLRQLIKQTAGADAELHHAVYHEKHQSYWSQHKRSPANEHNAALARLWFDAHQCDDLDPFGPAEAARIRQRRLARTPTRA